MTVSGAWTNCLTLSQEKMNALTPARPGNWWRVVAINANGASASFGPSAVFSIDPALPAMALAKTVIARTDDLLVVADLNDNPLPFQASSVPPPAAPRRPAGK